MWIYHFVSFILLRPQINTVTQSKAMLCFSATVCSIPHLFISPCTFWCTCCFWCNVHQDQWSPVGSDCFSCVSSVLYSLTEFMTLMVIKVYPWNTCGYLTCAPQPFTFLRCAIHGQNMSYLERQATIQSRAKTQGSIQSVSRKISDLAQLKCKGNFWSTQHILCLPWMRSPPMCEHCYSADLQC